jgi:hypothetical protein
MYVCICVCVCVFVWANHWDMDRSTIAPALPRDRSFIHKRLWTRPATARAVTEARACTGSDRSKSMQRACRFAHVGSSRSLRRTHNRQARGARADARPIETGMRAGRQAGRPVNRGAVLHAWRGHRGQDRQRQIRCRRCGHSGFQSKGGLREALVLDDVGEPLLPERRTLPAARSAGNV